MKSLYCDICAEVWHENVNDIEIVETPENQLYEIVGTYMELARKIKERMSNVFRKVTPAFLLSNTFLAYHESNPSHLQSSMNSCI